MKIHGIAIFALAAVVCAISSFGNNLVVWDSIEQSPVVGASVISSKGIIMGVTDVNGTIRADRGDYPLSVRSIGYESGVATVLTDTLFMAPATYAISEVTVTPSDRPISRVVTYAREYCTGATPTDTMQMYGEYMLEYFFADGKVKGFKKSDSNARELARRCYGRLANSAGLDSILRPTFEDDMAAISFLKIINLMPSSEREAPQAILNGATSDTVAGKYGPKLAFRKFNDLFTVDCDGLADHKDHHWEPWFFKMFGLTMDMTAAKWQRAYRFNEAGKYGLSDFLYSTCNLHIIAKGKLFKKILHVKDAMEIDCYIEEYPVAIEYLTVDEYQAIRKDKVDRTADFSIPSITLSLAPSIQHLVDRVSREIP